MGIDDACIFICRFANGAMGVFESTRYARGHKALKTFELNGADGSVNFDLHEPEWLDFFEYRAKETGEKVPSHTTGWRRIHVTNGEHPYMDHWWVPGLVIGYEHSFVHAVADFLAGLETGVPGAAGLPERPADAEGVRGGAAFGEIGTMGADGSGGLRHHAAHAVGGVSAVASKAAELYEEDFFAWTRDQATALRRLSKERWNGPLDLEHLAEEIEDVGSERRDAIRSQLRRIIEHCLKLEHSRAPDPRPRMAKIRLSMPAPRSRTS